jgi:hypothetical protein
MTQCKLPCIDCISLPMCKVRVREFGKLYLSDIQYIAVGIFISGTCSLIREYLAQHKEKDNKPLIETVDITKCKIMIKYMTKGIIYVSR